MQTTNKNVGNIRFEIPSKLLNQFETEYSNAKKSFNRAVNSWLLEDFNICFEKVEKPKPSETVLVKNLVKKRFFRLFPVFFVMDYLSSSQILSLWAVEHIEKDLHRRNKYLTHVRPNMKAQDEINLMTDCGYISPDDIFEATLKKRFVQ